MINTEYVSLVSLAPRFDKAQMWARACLVDTALTVYHTHTPAAVCARSFLSGMRRERTEGAPHRPVSVCSSPLERSVGRSVGRSLGRSLLLIALSGV